MSVCVCVTKMSGVFGVYRIDKTVRWNELKCVWYDGKYFVAGHSTRSSCFINENI